MLEGSNTLNLKGGLTQCYEHSASPNPQAVEAADGLNVILLIHGQPATYPARVARFALL